MIQLKKYLDIDKIYKKVETDGERNLKKNFYHDCYRRSKTMSTKKRKYIDK